MGTRIVFAERAGDFSAMREIQRVADRIAPVVERIGFIAGHLFVLRQKLGQIGYARNADRAGIQTPA